MPPNDQFSAGVGAGIYGSGESTGNIVFNPPPAGTPGGVPAQPSGFVASDNEYTDKVLLTWNSAAEALKYQLYRNDELLTTISGTSYEDTSASPGLVYRYSLIATNNTGSSSTSTDNGSKKLSGVDSLIAFSQDGQTIILQWEALSNTNKYKIYRGLTSQINNMIVIGETVTTQFIDLNATDDSVYFYSIIAVGDSGDGEYSSVSSSSLDVSKPNPPTLTVSDGLFENKIVLNWTQTERSIKYKIYRNGILIKEVPFDVLSYEDTSIQQGILYTYIVRAENINGELSDLDTNSDDTGWARLSRPSFLTATYEINEFNITVSWSFVQNATSYNVYRYVSGSPPVKIDSVLGTSYVDGATGNDLIFENEYNYFIRAVSVINGVEQESLNSPIARGKLAEPTPISPILVASQGEYDDKIEINWTNVQYAVHYTLYKNGSFLTTLTDNNYTDTSVDPAVNYSYKVYATNSRGSNSSFSNEITNAWRKLPAPILTVTNGVNDISLSWNSITNATSYKVYRGVHPGEEHYVLISTVSDTSYVDTNTDLIAGITYYYSIRAINTSFGEGTLSSFVDGIWLQVPSQPQGLTATQGSFTDKIRLTWSTSTNATSYIIKRNSSQIDLISDTGISTYTYDDTSAEQGISYTYTVQAASPTATSSDSASVSGWKKLSAPQNLQASDGTSLTEIFVSWDPVPNATSYKLYRRVHLSGGSYSLIATTTSTTYSDTNTDLLTETNYEYSVKASNALVDSDFSLSDIGILDDTTNIVIPSTPTGVSATQNVFSNRIVITWNASTNADGYYVFKNGSRVADVPLTIYYDENISPGTTNTYFIKAYNNSGGTGSESSTVTGKTKLQEDICNLSTNSDYKSIWAAAWHGVNQYSSGFTGKLGGRLAGVKSGGSFVTPNIMPMFWISNGDTWYNPNGTQYPNGPHSYSSARYHSDPSKDITDGGLVESRLYTTGNGGTPTRAKSFFDTLGIPVGKRVIFPWAYQTMLFEGYGANATYPKYEHGHPLDRCYVDNTNTTTDNDGFTIYSSPWMNNAKNRQAQKFDQWISEYHSIAGSVDFIVQDSESGGAFSIWGIRFSYGSEDIGDIWMRAIVDDPRFYDDTIQPGLGSLAHQLQYDSTKPLLNSGGVVGQFHPYGTDIGAIAPTYYGYTRWNKVLLRLFYKYLHEAEYDVAKTYYPNIKYSNYENYYVPDSDTVYEFNGHSQPSDSIRNSGLIANSFAFYGSNGGVLSNYELSTTDPNKLIFRPSGSNSFGSLPGDAAFKILVLEQNLARSIKRNSDAEFHPWIAYKSFSSTYQNNNYWNENVYQLCMLVPEVILYWNPSTLDNATLDTQEDTLLNNIIQEVNILSGGGLCGSRNISRIALNTNSIATGAETKVGDWLWRITVDKGKGFNVVIFGDTDQVNTDDVVIPVNDNGIWYRTNTNTLPPYTLSFTGPSSLTTTSGTDTNRVVLSWSSVSNATSYSVYRNNVLLQNNITSTTFDDTTAVPGTLYSYFVRAMVGSSLSAKSPTVTGWRKLALPSTTITVDSFEDKIRLTWTQVTGATSYNIYRSTQTNTTYSLIANTTSLTYDDTNTDLSYDTNYFYRIESVCALGSSITNPSNNLIGRLKTPQPSVFTISATNNLIDRVDLSWSAPLYASSAYVIKRNGINLTNGYSRSNYLRYSNTFTTGSQTPVMDFWSLYSGASISSTTKRMPTDDTNGEVGRKLTFTNNANNGIYQVISEAKTGEEFTLSVWVATESGSARFRLSYWNGNKSVYSVKDSGNDFESTGTPREQTDTDISKDFIATTTPRRFSFKFTTTSNVLLSNVAIGNGSQNGTGSIVIWGAQLEKGSTPTQLIVTTTSPIITTSYSDYTAASGVSYNYEVIAENRNNSRISNVAIGSRKTFAPVLNTVSTNLTDRIRINWNSVDGAVSYKIYRGTTSTSLALIQSGVVGTTFDDSDTDGVPLPNTTYYYAVVSTNLFGTDSEFSNIIYGFMPSEEVFNGDIFENYFSHNVTQYTNITIEAQKNNVYDNHFTHSRFYSPMLAINWNSLFYAKDNRYTKQIFYSNKQDDTNTKMNYLEKINVHNYGNYAKNFPVNNRLYLNFDVYRGEGDSKYEDDIYCTTPSYAQLLAKNPEPTLPPR